LHLLALCRSIKLLLKIWGQASTPTLNGPSNYHKQDFVILVLVVIGLPLTAIILLLKYHFVPLFRLGDKVELILLWERTVGNFSGVSPIMPLALIATATLTWALCSLRRLRLLERRTPSTSVPAQPATQQKIVEHDELGFLAMETREEPNGATGDSQKPASEGITQLEQKVHFMISCSFDRLPGCRWTIFWVVLASLITMGVRLMPSVEGIWYNRGITALFILAYLAIAINFLRFLVIWVALHRLLRRLSWHPLLMGYTLPREDKDPVLSKLRLDLSSPIPTFTTLTKSVEQARLLCRRVQQANSKIGSQLNSGTIKKISDAERQLTYGFNYDAIRNWQRAFDARKEVRIKLIEFSKEVSAILQQQWITESQGGECATGIVTEPMNGKQTDLQTDLKTKKLAGISQSGTAENLVTIKDTDQAIFGQAERFL